MAGTLLHDTAGFIHLTLVRDQLVRPHLSQKAFAASLTPGVRLDVPAILAEHGV